MNRVRLFAITTAFAIAGCPAEKPAEQPKVEEPPPPPPVERPQPPPEPRETKPFVDVLAVASDRYKLIEEGDWVRLMRATFKPGEKDQPHSHPRSIVYALTPIVGNEHTGGGKVTPVNHPAGTAFAREAVHDYSFENTSKQEVRFLVYEIEESAPPPEALEDRGPDPVAVSPDIYTVLAENDKVRLLMLAMNPGTKDQPHSLQTYMTYTLTDVKGRFHVGRMQNVSLKKDVCHINEPIPSFSFENTGSKEAKILILERKG